MSKFVKSSVFGISILMVAVLAAGCSSRFVPSGEERVYPQSPRSSSSLEEPINGWVQSDTGGRVTIDVEWTKTENGSLVFDVAMNTHSVDLDQYDLGKLAVLRDDIGNEYHPVSWHSASGGHHRKGTLAFPLPDSLDRRKIAYFELILHDIAGVEERVLKWELE